MVPWPVRTAPRSTRITRRQRQQPFSRRRGATGNCNCDQKWKSTCSSHRLSQIQKDRPRGFRGYDEPKENCRLLYSRRIRLIRGQQFAVAVPRGSAPPRDMQLAMPAVRDACSPKPQRPGYPTIVSLGASNGSGSDAIASSSALARTAHAIPRASTAACTMRAPRK